MNHLVLSGTLDGNPESFGPELGVIFTLRVREPRSPLARCARLSIVCRNELADVVLSYLADGDEIALTGKLRSQDGHGRASLELVIDQIEFHKVRAELPGPGDLAPAGCPSALQPHSREG